MNAIKVLRVLPTSTFTAGTGSMNTVIEALRAEKARAEASSSSSEADILAKIVRFYDYFFSIAFLTPLNCLTIDFR